MLKVRLENGGAFFPNTHRPATTERRAISYGMATINREPVIEGKMRKTFENPHRVLEFDLVDNNLLELSLREKSEPEHETGYFYLTKTDVRYLREFLSFIDRHMKDLTKTDNEEKGR